MLYDIYFVNCRMKYKKRANKYIKKDLRMFFKFNKEYNKKQRGSKKV